LQKKWIFQQAVNAGNIDSAAMLIYCAGKHRYSFPDPARFLIHSNALTLGVNYLLQDPIGALPLEYTTIPPIIDSGPSKQ
jgi:hypothetical protein